MKTYEKTADMSTLGSAVRYSERAFYYDYKGRTIQTVEKNLNGNKLMNLAGINGGTALSGANYTYDGNGNMTHDGRMNLDVTYDLFGMPQSVQQNGTLKCAYTYLADGTKVMVQDDANSSSSNGYLYLGSTVFKKTGTSYAFESTDFGGGRIINVNGTLSPYYYTADHLGSVRVITDASGNVTERNDYYAFGKRMTTGSTYPVMTSNRWKYNGKEVQTTGNVNWLDYGAREYDEVIGRWTRPDPMSEKYYGTSGYTYCANNPINLVDLNGNEWLSSEDEKIAKATRDATITKSNELSAKEKRINAKIERIKSNEKSGDNKKNKQVTNQELKLADIQAQKDYLLNLGNGIVQLGESKNMYTFNTVKTESTELSSETNGTIIINNFGTIGSRAHEITHAIQYNNGLFTFKSFGESDVNYNKSQTLLEMEAYSTEYSITGGIVRASSNGGVPNSVLGITPQWLYGLSVNNKFIYKSY